MVLPAIRPAPSLRFGKRQRAPVPLVCGAALMVYPYFVSNNVVLAAVGAALTAIPYFIRL